MAYYVKTTTIREDLENVGKLIDKAFAGVAGMFGLNDVYADLRNFITNSGTNYEQKMGKLTSVINDMKALEIDPQVSANLLKAQNVLSQAISRGGSDKSSVWAANRAAGMAKQKSIAEAQSNLEKANAAYERESNRVSRNQNLVNTAMALADRDTVSANQYFDDVVKALEKKETTHRKVNVNHV